LDGILNIFKPEGITSYGVIREVKRYSGEKKIGHIGTLDPFAQGVLPLFLGKMTKLIHLMNNDEKTYRVKAKLGYHSNTLDREGELIEVPVPDSINPDSLQQTLLTFLGEIEQIPPMYSAVKVDGKRLYEYARKGEEIERKSRKIRIFWIKNIEISLPYFGFDVHCSKGTYIRTLVSDMAVKMGSGAYLTDLTRTQCGRFFSLNDSIELDQINNINKSDLQKKFIDPQCLLPGWHIITANSFEMRKNICQGRLVPIGSDDIRFSQEGKDSLNAIVKDKDKRLIAIGSLEFSQDCQYRFHPSKVLI